MSSFDTFLRGDPGPENEFDFVCPRCGRTYVFSSIPASPVVCHNPEHEPVDLVPQSRKHRSGLDLATADLAPQIKEVARQILWLLSSANAPIRTESVLVKLQLTPLSFATVITRLVERGLISTESEGTPKEAIRLTSKGRDLLPQTA
jgi:predicted transcriptional regulator